jgi:hypothetical protein
MRDVISPVQITFSKIVQVINCHFTRVAFLSGSLPVIGEISGTLQVFLSPGLKLIKLPSARIPWIHIRAPEDSKFPLQVEFPELSNSSEIYMFGVAQIKIPKLTELDNFTFASSQAPSVYIPRLGQVQEYLSISKSEKLITLTLPSLQNVGKNLDIYGNNILKDLSLPKLSQVGKRLLTDGSFEKYFRLRYLHLTRSTVLTGL